MQWRYLVFLIKAHCHAGFLGPNNFSRDCNKRPFCPNLLKPLQWKDEIYTYLCPDRYNLLGAKKSTPGAYIGGFKLNRFLVLRLAGHRDLRGQFQREPFHPAIFCGFMF